MITLYTSKNQIPLNYMVKIEGKRFPYSISSIIKSVQVFNATYKRMKEPFIINTPLEVNNSI